jgi:hypothetical protein
VNTLRVLKREAQKTIKLRGVIGTLCAAARFIYFRLRRLISKNKNVKTKLEADLNFDSKYGVNTSGIIRLSSLDIEDKNWIYGIYYEPINHVQFNELLAELDISYEQYVFIDFGSGKGRAVLLASALPFKKIIGIEFSKEFTSIAEKNLGLYPEEEMRCKNIELICMDAVEYDLPDEQLVLYFNNPFRGPVMQQVIDNVRTSYRKKRRRIIVLYLYPFDAKLWNNVEFLETVKSTPELRFYDTRKSEIMTPALKNN